VEWVDAALSLARRGVHFNNRMRWRLFSSHPVRTEPAQPNLRPSDVMALVRVSAALLLACALVACRTQVHPAATRSGLADKHSAAGAQATAAAGLAAVPLPPGARSRPTPAISMAELGGPQAATRADAVHTWYVPLSPDAAIGWFVAHVPALRGERPPAAGGDGKEYLAYGQGAGLDKPQTQIVITRNDPDSNVLIDALVLWTPEKAPLQTIPVDVTMGTFDFVRPAWLVHEVHPGATPAHTTVRVKGLTVHRALTKSEVGQVRAFINAEPTDVQDSPTMPSSCAMGYETATVTFHYGGETEVFAVDLQGCGRISPTINGTAAPYTRGGNDFANQLRAIAGLPAGDPRPDGA
jgi:hypothetical protein